jgi:hypothetical protein
MVEMNNAKVFGIGFHKTGTSCLDKALEILGYRVCRENFGNKVFEQLGYQLCLENLEEIPSFQKDIYKVAHSLVDKYDAFQDVPWFLFYEELYKKHPNSKFVLTTRATDSWIRSVKCFNTSKKNSTQVYT